MGEDRRQGEESGFRGQNQIPNTNTHPSTIF